MKTIDYYLNLPYKLVIVPDPEEGGYVARYP
jgi:antitoxin HicB